MTSTSSPPRLPLWQTVRNAYATVIARFGQFIHMAGAWIVGSTFVMAALYYTVGWSAYVDILVARKPTGMVLWGTVLPELIGLTAGIVLAVGWHRYILLGHEPRAAWLLERPTIQYSGWVLLSIAYTIALLSPFFALYFLGSKEISDPIVASPIVENIIIFVVLFPFITIACYLPTRFSLILPARALDHVSISAGDVWRRSRKNFWAMYLGLTACGLVPFAFGLALPEKFESREFFAIAYAANYLVALIAGMVGVTFLSLAYRHLFPEMFETKPPLGQASQ